MGVPTILGRFIQGTCASADFGTLRGPGANPCGPTVYVTCLEGHVRNCWAMVAFLEGPGGLKV